MSSTANRPLLIFPCNGNGVEALDCLGGAYESDRLHRRLC